MSGDADQPEIPMIFFSGMGADASVFFSQSLAFPNLTVPDWDSPLPQDDLQSYCARMALKLDPKRPCIVGGASFGGIVALEMTRHLEALACILIGSVRGPQQLPKRIRILRRLSWAIKFAPIKFLQRAARTSAVAARSAGAKNLASIAMQFSDADAAVLRWSASQILSWKSTYEGFEIRHIHGDRDRVFPIAHVEPDEIVIGGGHVISMTHGTQVNSFLRKHISQIAGD